MFLGFPIMPEFSNTSPFRIRLSVSFTEAKVRQAIADVTATNVLQYRNRVKMLCSVHPCLKPTRRVPVQGTSDYFDRLTRSANVRNV